MGHGSDGNSNSKGGENQVSGEFSKQIQLSGGSSFQAQLNTLSRCGAEDDLTFREGSVKDVTDRGRTQAASKLESALKQAASAAGRRRSEHKPAVKRKAEQLGPAAGASSSSSSSSLSAHDKAEEIEVRREVRVLLERLRGYRAGHQSEFVAVDALRLLEQIPVTVACLKATKVAAELNLPSWRVEGAPAELRARASSLVRRWRVMYKADEDGGDAAQALPPAMVARVSRIVSMDLEETAFTHKQRTALYAEIVEAICALLEREPTSAVSLLTGSTTTKDFVGRVAESVTVRKRSLGGNAQRR